MATSTAARAARRTAGRPAGRPVGRSVTRAEKDRFIAQLAARSQNGTVALRTRDLSEVLGYKMTTFTGWANADPPLIVGVRGGSRGGWGFTLEAVLEFIEWYFPVIDEAPAAAAETAGGR